jgi:hypothetical protein
MSAPRHFQESIQPLVQVTLYTRQVLASLSGPHFEAGCFLAIGAIRERRIATIQDLGEESAPPSGEDPL